MTKIELLYKIIEAFKYSCTSSNIHQYNTRLNAVKHQFQRYIWDISTIYGLVRITSTEPQNKIILFPFNNDKLFKEVIEFPISDDLYEELRKIYFGKFEEDKEYFKRIEELYSNTNKQK